MTSYIRAKGWWSYFALIHGGCVDSDADATNKIVLTRKAIAAFSPERQHALNLGMDSLACALRSFFTHLPQHTSGGMTRTFLLKGPSLRHTLMRRAPRKAPKVAGRGNATPSFWHTLLSPRSSMPRAANKASGCATRVMHLQ